MKNKQATRYNKGKLRWRNIPMFFVRPLVEVGQMGEEKYGAFNFLKGAPVLDTLESLHRHLDAFEDPHQSDFDKETKLLHVAHIAWNALFIVYTLKYKPKFDNRFKVKK